MNPSRTESESFATASCAYACLSCESINDSTSAEWCSCVTSRPTLTCAACGSCFCAAPRAWWLSFLVSPAAPAFRRRSAELTHPTIPRPSDVAPSDLARPVILIVDDDKVIHLIAKRVLADLGGTVVHATDGEAGFRLAMAVRPDVVITDALLPKLDGRELARILKTTPETSRCRVAVVTALYKGSRYRAEAFKRFLVDAYAEKPLAPDALHSLVRSLLPEVAPIPASARRPAASLGASR